MDALAVEDEAYRRGLNLTADRAGRVSLSMPLILDADTVDRVAGLLGEAIRATVRR